MRFTVGVILPLILAAGAGLAPQARAQDDDPGEPRRRDLSIKNFIYRLGPGIEAGPLRIHPYASQFVIYDDNVFLVDSEVADEREEISLETVLGTRVDLPYEKHLFNAAYEVELVEYVLHGTRDLIRHKAGAEAILDFDPSYANADVLYRNTDDPVASPELGRFRRAEVGANLVGGHKFERVGVEAGLHDRYYDYFDRATEYLDHNEFFLHLQGSYEVSEKLRPYVRYDYGQADFTDEESGPSSFLPAGVSLNDYTWNKVWLGAYYAPEQKLSLHARAGWLVQTVDEESGTIGDDEEYNGFIAGTAVSYAATEKVGATVGFLRDIQFSGQGNFQLIDRFDLRVDYQATEKVLASFLGFFEHTNPSAAESFSRFGMAVILDYRINEYLHVGVQYQHRQRSGLETTPGEYSNNRVLGNVTIYF